MLFHIERTSAVQLLAQVRHSNLRKTCPVSYKQKYWIASLEQEEHRYKKSPDLQTIPPSGLLGPFYFLPGDIDLKLFCTLRVIRCVANRGSYHPKVTNIKKLNNILNQFEWHILNRNTFKKAVLPAKRYFVHPVGDLQSSAQT